MKVRVLGTAAGGGAPQWNCACVACERLRAAGIARTQDCVAISATGDAWYLLNASPDLRAQLLATPELSPGPEPRRTPLRGVLFTSAELDHTLGVVGLREAVELTVFGTAAVLDGLAVRAPLEAYGASIEWRPVVPDEPFWLDDDRLRVDAVPLGSKRPRYAADRPEAPDWVVGYRVTDVETDGTLVYAPCVGEWSAALSNALDGASCLLLDGSFHTDNEMREVAGRGGTARSMGHLPIVDSLPYRTKHPDTRWLYTHLNNTNPVLLDSAPERAAVLAASAEIPADGQLLTL